RRLTESLSALFVLTHTPKRFEGVRMYWYGAKLNRSAFVNRLNSARVGVLSGGFEIVWLLPNAAGSGRPVMKRPPAEALLQPLPPMLQVVWPGFGNCEIERSREKTGPCLA